jgi:DNA-binding transcriptional MerR regulator
MYRNYGFSLDEIVDLLNTSPEDNIQMFEDRRQSVEAEIRRQQSCWNAYKGRLDTWETRYVDE